MTTYIHLWSYIVCIYIYVQFKFICIFYSLNLNVYIESSSYLTVTESGVYWCIVINSCHLWLHWIFVAGRGFTLVVASRAAPHCSVQASLYAGWSLEHRLEVCGLRSCSGIWNTGDQTRVLHTGKWILNYWATREVQDLALIEQLLIAFDAYTYQLIFTIILRDKFHYYPQHHTSKIQHAQNESPASATTNFPHCCLVPESCPALLWSHGL